MVLPVSPVAPTKNTVCFDIFKSKYVGESFIVPVNDGDGDVIQWKNQWAPSALLKVIAVNELLRRLQPTSTIS
jgi:hypothetical protein